MIEVAGPSANNGCPWPDTDGDTVLDKDDKCPSVAGLTTNNGCPQPTKEVMEELNVVGAKVPFQLNKASFGNQVTTVLDIVFGIMQKYPTTKFVIEGQQILLVQKLSIKSFLKTEQILLKNF